MLALHSQHGKFYTQEGDALKVNRKERSATMTAPRKSSQVSTTVSPEVFEALEDHRWTARKKMTEVIAEAVSDYIAKHGIKVAAPVESAPEVKPKA